MSNLIKVTRGDEVQRTILSPSDSKLVVILYTTKQKDCHQILMALEKSALINKATLFCHVEAELFSGDSMYLPHLRDVANMPRLDCFHRSKSIGTIPNAPESSVIEFVAKGQEYLIRQAQAHYGTGFNDTLPGLPTLQQIRYMFTLWNLMQQAGMLQPYVPAETASEPIVLDNGDEIIPLEGGKFKLIKNSQKN